MLHHIHDVRSGERADSIADRPCWNSRRRTGDLEPVVVAESAVPAVTAGARLVETVKPYLRAGRIRRHWQIERLRYMIDHNAGWILAVAHRRNDAAADDLSAGMKTAERENVAELCTPPLRERTR